MIKDIIFFSLFLPIEKATIINTIVIKIDKSVLGFNGQ
jgi:hypothetical protein